MYDLCSPGHQFGPGILDDDELDMEWVIRNVFEVMAVGFGLGGIFFRCSFGRVLCLDADLFCPFRSSLPSPRCVRGLRLARRGSSVLGRVEARRVQERSG